MLPLNFQMLAFYREILKSNPIHLFSIPANFLWNATSEEKIRIFTVVTPSWDASQHQFPFAFCPHCPQSQHTVLLNPTSAIHEHLGSTTLVVTLWPEAYLEKPVPREIMAHYTVMSILGSPWRGMHWRLVRSLRVSLHRPKNRGHKGPSMTSSRDNQNVACGSSRGAVLSSCFCFFHFPLKCCHFSRRNEGMNPSQRASPSLVEL